MQIRLSTDTETLDRLQASCFKPSERLPTNEGHWWIALDGATPVGFAALRTVPSWEDTAYMARCGVIHTHRGQGIQKRLLQRREQWAKKHGYVRIITTTYRNPASANSLIARGFKTYMPMVGWGAADTIYWLKNL